MDLAYKSIIEIKELIDSQQITKQEVWEYFLSRAKEWDSKIHSFNTFHEDGFNDSEEILSGIPLGVKDIFCEKWRKTTASSKMLENYIPPYNATIIERLQHAWMSSLWKCNMDEFAMGTTTENSAFKNTINPWGTNRIPGWSSGWSAAAVAAWLVPAALGTDTWGSIRQPASVCGVVGFKPSYGRNSRFGIMPMASSLDCPWTLTRTVKDAAFLYELMNGEDKLESSCLPGKDTIDSSIWEKQDLKWKTIWIPKEYFDDGLDAWSKKTIMDAVEKMRELWAEVKEVSLPMTKYAIAAYYIICPAEVSTNLARLDGIRYGHNSEIANESLEDIYLHNRGEGLGDEPKRRSILGSYVLSAWFYDAYYKKAAQIRTLISQDFEKVFQEVDVLMTPATPDPAWKIWEISDDPLKLYLADAFTIPASLAGLPWICVPCGFTESTDREKELLPVWVQMLCPRLEEQKLFEIAHIYEKNAGWAEKMIPKGFEV